MIDFVCTVQFRGSENCTLCCTEAECAAKLKIPLGFSRADMQAEHCAISHLQYPEGEVCPTWGCEQCICGPLHRKELKRLLKDTENL